MVALLLVMHAATAVYCCCRCGSACQYDCQCFLVVHRLLGDGMLFFLIIIFKWSVHITVCIMGHETATEIN